MSYPLGQRALQVLINILINISINKTQVYVSNMSLKNFLQMTIDFYGRYFFAFNQEQTQTLIRRNTLFNSLQFYPRFFNKDKEQFYNTLIKPLW